MIVNALVHLFPPLIAVLAGFCASLCRAILVKHASLRAYKRNTSLATKFRGFEIQVLRLENNTIKLMD